MANKTNLNVRLITAALLLGILSAPAALAVEYGDFPTDLQLILDERIAELDTEGGICIAGQVTFSDGTPITGGADVLVNLYHEGLDEPMWVYEDGWFIMGRTGSSAYVGPDKGFVLRAFGYDAIDASATVLDGEMTYLEFVMAKTPPENLATIEGEVYDGSGFASGSGWPWPSTWQASVSIYFPFANNGLGTYPYMSKNVSYTVGHGGADFSFEDLSVCEHEVTATAEGYDYDTELVTPPAVWPDEVSLKIYPNRTIVIDYVYQADGSRDFTTGDVQTGTIEWLNGEGGVDFSGGQVVIGDGQDLSIVQQTDILRFEAIEPNGLNGFYDAGLVDFESVVEAGETGYSTDSKLSKVGHVYVAKTGEGNYAKFIIQSFEMAGRKFSIVPSWPSHTEVEFPGYELWMSAYCADPCGQCWGPDAVGVSKFCGGSDGLQGTILPYVWQIIDDSSTWHDPTVFLITLVYDEGDVTSVGLSENELTVFQSPDDGVSWHRLETARNPSTNKLYVQADRLSWFVVGSENTEILPRVIYVDDDATSVFDPCDPWSDPMYYHGDGASWETAYKYLQDAFESANEGDEIRVAGGTYRPDIYRPWYGWSRDRNSTFQLINGVAIYGGYAGIGALVPDERNVELYESILTGDLDENDGGWNSGENCYHVVTGSGTDATAILDGLTITRGLADGISSEPTYHGGGMYNDNGSPTLVNCTFDRNYAKRSPGLYNCNGSDPNIINCTFTRNWGVFSIMVEMGALYSENSSPAVTNCTFIDNFSTGMFSGNSFSKITNCTFVGNEGAGMDNRQGDVTVVNCTFTGNDGAGMYNLDGEVKVTDCNFVGNGGGMTNWKSDSEVVNCTFTGNGDLTNEYEGRGGGMSNFECAPVITNCIFTGNKADFGGAMSNGWGARPVLVNCTFSENHAWLDGGGIYNEEEIQWPELGPTKPVLIECTFSNNSANRHGGGTYNWDSDPNLIDCVFRNNSAGWGGGGMCNYRDCTVSMLNCTFTENSQTREDRDGGGAIFNFSNNILTVENCTFSQNTAQVTGGGIQNGAEYYGLSNIMVLRNCHFFQNTACYGGGGIGNVGQLSLINCIFTENRSYDKGGAISGSMLTIDKCIFIKNISRGEEHGYGGSGGAIFFFDSDFTITNSIFVDNTALGERGIVLNDIYDRDILDTGSGGAVYISYSSGVIDSCLFSGNSAGYSGGLFLDSTYESEHGILLNNCTVVGNSARYYGGGLFLEWSVDVSNCIIRDNRASRGPQIASWYLDSTINYCDIEGGEEDVFLWDMWGQGASIDWGEGNIDADPGFVQPGWWDPNETPTDPNDDFWVDGDYHLQPTSPCIDVGDNSAVDPNSTDFDGNPRIVDGNDDDNRVVDMGAYEYWKYARNPADLNGDGVVDYRDFVILGSNWMEENCPISAWCAGCDLNHSGEVDSTDLFRVVRSWLWQMETVPDLDLDLDNLWMYQNLPDRTASNLTATVSIAYDPLDNSSYTYDWEIILPDDVSILPTIIAGGEATDPFCTIAAPACDQPGGLSDLGQMFTLKVTVTGDNFGNSGQAEAEFGIALLGDVNNDAVVNVADRGIINAFWQDGFAGSFSLRDCDLNCDGSVNVADRSIANAIWQGVLGANSVSEACPLR